MAVGGEGEIGSCSILVVYSNNITAYGVWCEESTVEQREREDVGSLIDR